MRIATFDFNTQQTAEAASELLRNLDINRMLQNAETAKTAANFSNQNEVATKATIGEDSHKMWVPPLSVSLVGLSAEFCCKEELHRAFVSPIDFTDRLRSLSTQIVQRFVSAEIGNGRMGEILQPYPAVIDTWKARHRRPTKADDGAKILLEEPAPYDTRGLIEKYKDVVLAESIPLEKLSLCKIGRIAKFKGVGNRVLVDEYYEEIESIPLPQ